MSLIEVNNLFKEFQIAKRQEGLGGALRSLVRREYLTRTAVQDVSFAVGKGEMVGYVGPNGAGKSTTIKMLTGILVPTSGVIRVNGLIPYRERQKNARQIGVVFGQRTQLWWDLPVIESFLLLKQIFQVPDQRYKQNMATFSDILGLDEFLNTPVRQLSLGQRMRADIAASLLHDPMILFLDEPTIGLDVLAKERMRQFISEINQKRGVTVILTTHDMSDIEKLCRRMILIDNGQVMYDGELALIKDLFGKERVLIVDLEGETGSFSVAGAHLIKEEGNRKWLRFSREVTAASQLINRIAEKYEIKDLTIKDTEIEVMIRHIYEKGITSYGGSPLPGDQ
ncbi:MAG: Methionine import ATP-binding protein MetN 2 [Firmicutes bacterium ADurb.Bin373]|nr:MAG: Methionine import ATP-binding protein MetN 2 [Firmicutes bacterium ADurb.Bin373]